MELEEAIKILKEDLVHTKKANECGLATKGEFNNEIEAINIVLNQLDSLKFKYQARKDRTDTIIKKQEKMIEVMARFIDTELSSEHLSKVLKIDVKPLETYREDIKQYFEKKAEESE